MDLKPLVEGECGDRNALMKIAQHLTQPQDLFSSKFQQKTNYLSGKWAEELSNVNNYTVPNDTNRFKMDSLLQSVENTQNQRTANQVASTNRSFEQNQSNIWANEFMRENMKVSDFKVNDFIDASKVSNWPVKFDNSKWAEEYLDLVKDTRFDTFTQSAPDLLMNNETNIWSADYLDNIQPNDITNRSNIGHNFTNNLQSRNSAQLFESFAYPLGHNSVTVAHQLTNSQETIEQVSGVQGLLDGKVENFVSDVKKQVSVEDEVSFVEDENDFWHRLSKECHKNQSQYNEDTESVEDSFHNLLKSDVESHMDVQQNDYPFAPDNYYDEIKDLPDYFEEGMRRLNDNDLPAAVRCFELACKNEPTNAKYWQYLGTTQASNEHDLVAIKALKRCVAIEPTNLAALMGLAVCYTNESMHQQACKTLKHWMLNNGKYNSILEFTNDEFNDSSCAKQNLIISSMSKANFDKVKDMFIAAARLYPYEPDADVQCGLGVLFNISGEYDKATDCFKCALTVRSDDPCLWNRLGTTLTNGNRNEEAVAAYRRALELNPGFIRTRYNLGIVCVHLGAYREAVEHFLTVLNLQNLAAKDKTPGHLLINCQQMMSDNVWQTMKLTLSFMKRHDLHAKLEERDLEYLNQQFDMEF